MTKNPQQNGWYGERSLRRLTELVSRTDLPVSSKLRKALLIGRDAVDVSVGFLAELDGESLAVTEVSGPGAVARRGQRMATTAPHCRATLDGDGPLGIESGPDADGDLPCYIGGRVEVDGETWGMLCFADTDARSKPFTGSERMFVELLAQVVSYELERERRESELAARGESLRRLLDTLNGLVRDFIRVLVNASTRTEIERGICERLVDSEPYVFARFDGVDLRDETLQPRQWAGGVAAPMEDLRLALGDDAESSPAAAAFDQRSMQIVEDLSTHPVGDRWQVSTLHRETGAMAAVPIDYDGATLGVMNVFAEPGHEFDERERVVLKALADAVANGINAIESERILPANHVIEATFAIEGPELPFNELSTAAGCTLEYSGSAYRQDGTLRTFCTATGADPEVVATAATALESVVDATHLNTTDESHLFEFSVTSSLVGRLAEQGIVTQGLSVAGGRATVELTFSDEKQARSIFALLEERYGHVDILKHRERTSRRTTRQDFTATLESRLTDRQRTALRSAFLSGYYDPSRGVTGDELASLMDISRATFHEHLRAAERKVFDELFGHA